MACAMIKQKRPNFQESTLSHTSILNRQSQLCRALWMLLMTSGQSSSVAERCQPKYQKDVTISMFWPYALNVVSDPDHYSFSSRLCCLYSTLFVHRAIVGCNWLSDSQDTNMQQGGKRGQLPSFIITIVYYTIKWTYKSDLLPYTCYGYHDFLLVYM